MNYEVKDMLNDILSSQKHITGMYNTFANECVSEDLRSCLINILNKEHEVQADVFKEMQKRGWYNVPKVKKEDVEMAKTKFENVLQSL